MKTGYLISCLLAGFMLLQPLAAVAAPPPSETVSVPGGNWRIYGWTMGGDCSLFYDDENCARLSADTVRVPVIRTGWSNDCKAKEQANLRRLGFPEKEMVNWSQTLQYYELNLRNKTYRVVSTAAYDGAGNVIGQNQAATGWMCIVPGSATDKLYKALTAVPQQEQAQQEGPRTIEIPVPVLPQEGGAQHSSRAAPPSALVPFYQ